MNNSIKQSIFLVLDDKNRPRGAGCVLALENGECIAVTSAHIFNEAEVKNSDSQIKLLFDHIKYAREITADISDIFPQEDIAFLKIPPEYEIISPLRLSILRYTNELPFIIMNPVLEDGNLMEGKWKEIQIKGMHYGDTGNPILDLFDEEIAGIYHGAPIINDKSDRVFGIYGGRTVGETGYHEFILAEIIQVLKPELVFDTFAEETKQRKQAHELLEGAQSSLFNQNYQKALDVYFEVNRLPIIQEGFDIDLSNATDRFRNQLITSCLESADQREKNGDLEEALRLWKVVIDLNPRDEYVWECFGRTERVISLIRDADTCEQEGKLDTALDLWRKVAAQLPRYELALHRQRTIQNQIALIEFINRAKEAGRIDNAISFLEQARYITHEGTPTEFLKNMLAQKINEIKMDEQKQLEAIDHLTKDLIAAEEIAKKESEERYRVESILKSLKEAEKQLRKIYASLAYPKCLSKRFPSTILVSIFPKYLTNQAKTETVRQIIQIGKKEEEFKITGPHSTEIEMETSVNVTIECPGIRFTSSVTINISDKVTKLFFLIKPEDTCEVGKHMAKLSICDSQSKIEIFSLPFEIRVVDFLVDHISRPFLLKLMAAIGGVAAVAMYILTFLGQVDTAFGLTSGTAIGVASITFYLQFYNLFQRLRGSGGNP